MFNKKAVEIQIPLPNLAFLKILPPVFFKLASPALYESSCFDDGGVDTNKIYSREYDIDFLDLSNICKMP